jgi:hypothetical protein
MQKSASFWTVTPIRFSIRWISDFFDLNELKSKSTNSNTFEAE